MLFCYILDMTHSDIILGIESSCDETSVAVLKNGSIFSNIVSSQYVHQRYGGVVPELASRAHQKLIIPVVEEALQKAGVAKEDLSAVAAAHGPGLMGSLLVGLNFSKAFAFGLGIPFIAVNHMEAHIYSNFVEEPHPVFPFLSLTVSGGHTQLILARDDFNFLLLGETRDDAAGEAFDKVAKMLGLGYPGGPVIDTLASEGNPDAIRFPRTLLPDDPFGFSFSGIKTAVLYYLRDEGLLTETPTAVTMTHQRLADIAASFQLSVVDVLVRKTIDAARAYGVREIGVAGGVSANSGLRTAMKKAADENQMRLHIPRIEYCTDNGAMIAVAGYRRYLKKSFSPLSTTAVANLDIA
jgi:N6-L-threonylcarbamoyladenine synthase